MSGRAEPSNRGVASRMGAKHLATFSRMSELGRRLTMVPAASGIAASLTAEMGALLPAYEAAEADLERASNTFTPWRKRVIGEGMTVTDYR